MKIIRWLVVPLTLMVFAMAALPSVACDPDDMTRQACDPWIAINAGMTATAIANLPPTLTPLPTATLTPTPTPKPPLPLGVSPATARDVPDEWQALDPHASVWYKTSYSDSFRLLEYWLETNLPDVAEFAVYSPDQKDGLSAATRPVGRGTHSKNDLENIIRWKAGYALPGIWYVYLTNRTDNPISFKLNHNQENVQTKTCISYWEPLGGVMILWTDCGRYGPPK